VRIRWFLAFGLTLQGSLAPAALVIGTANAEGSFSIDSARVFGHATLFEGTILETTHATSRLDMAGGARLQLAPDSRGRVYSDRLVLERGAGEIQRGVYRIEANVLRVTPAPKEGAVKVSWLAGNRIEVAALAGAVRVANAEGLLLASIDAGRALEFAPPGGGAVPPSMVTGCVVPANGAFLLTDEVSGVSVVLRGSGITFGDFAGKVVEVSGSIILPAPTDGAAAEVLEIRSVKVIAKACVTAQPRAPANRKASSPHQGAVIAGVVITAGVGVVAGILVTREKTPAISAGR
jgi:hypothetical protein